jgi:hypothetical protein
LRIIEPVAYSNKGIFNLKPLIDYFIKDDLIKPTDYLTNISFVYCISPAPSETLFTSLISIQNRSITMNTSLPLKNLRLFNQYAVQNYSSVDHSTVYFEDKQTTPANIVVNFSFLDNPKIFNVSNLLFSPLFILRTDLLMENGLSLNPQNLCRAF